MNTPAKLIPLLKEIGLNQSEIAIYLASITIDIPQTSGILAKRASLKQSTATMALKALINKGLISTFSKDAYTFYLAESPSLLINYLERKQKQIEHLKEETKILLPQIHRLEKSLTIKPQIKVFEGIEGIKKVFWDMMDLGDEIFGYASLYKEIDEPFEDFWKQYFKKVVQKSKKIKLIVSNTKEGEDFQKRDKQENRQTILVPKEKYFFTTEKHIVGNTIANISLFPDALLAIVIEDENITNTEKCFFDLNWNNLLKVNHP